MPSCVVVRYRILREKKKRFLYLTFLRVTRDVRYHNVPQIIPVEMCVCVVPRCVTTPSACRRCSCVVLWLTHDVMNIASRIYQFCACVVLCDVRHHNALLINIAGAWHMCVHMSALCRDGRTLRPGQRRRARRDPLMPAG